MASFAAFIPKLAEAEGGYQDNPADAGNYNGAGVLVGTNFGIAAKTLEAWRGRPVSRADMQALSQTEAHAIYRAWFWNDVKGDHIESQAAADILADAQVNHPATAVRLWQTVLNAHGAELIVDGAFGPKTLSATNDADTPFVHNEYRLARQAWYRYRAAAPGGSGFDALFSSWGLRMKASQAVFLAGWLNRLDLFPPLPAVGPTLQVSSMDLVALNREKKTQSSPAGQSEALA